MAARLDDVIDLDEPSAVTAYRYDFQVFTGEDATFEDDSIRESMVVSGIWVTPETAQGGDWEIVTEEGKLTINGTITADANVSAVLVDCPLGEADAPPMPTPIPYYVVTDVSSSSGFVDTEDGYHAEFKVHVDGECRGVEVYFSESGDRVDSYFTRHKNSPTLTISARYSAYGSPSVHIPAFMRNGHAEIVGHIPGARNIDITINDPTHLDGDPDFDNWQSLNVTYSPGVSSDPDTGDKSIFEDTPLSRL